MKKSFLFIFLLCCNTAFATVTATLDRNPIAFGETVNLTITSDESSGDMPDFSALNKSFTVLATSNSTQITMLNGQQTQELSWTLSLLPNQQGILTIPAFKVGNEMTAPLTLTVQVAGKASNNSKNAPVFMETSLDPKTAYVGAAVNYTMRLYYSVNGLSGQVTPPAMDKLAFNQIGKDNNYQIRRDGKIYGVLERHYLFFPQQSGSLKIPGATFDGMMPLSNTQASLQAQLLAMGGGQTLHLVAPDLTLQVNPLPGEASFAAKAVNLSDSWSSAPQNVPVGQPVTRTITMRVTGLNANQIPALNSAISAPINVYPSQAQFDTQTNSNDIVGTRTDSIAYIPQQSGHFTLPALQLKWLNTKTGTIQTTNLPAVNFVATGAATVTTPTNVAPAASIVPTAQTAATNTSTHRNNIWLWIAIIIAIIWVITLFLWWRSHRKPNAPQPRNVSPQDRRAAVELACQKNSPKDLQTAILNWARDKWPESEIHNLHDIIAQTVAPTFAAELQSLTAVLYKKQMQNYNGITFWKAFLEQEKYQPETAKEDKDSLPPLYPES